MKNIKYISLVIIATLMLGFASVNPTQAQIILTEQDENSNRTLVNGTPFPLTDLPNHDSAYDYFAPLGGGVWVLSAVGLAYLAGKKKKEK